MTPHDAVNTGLDLTKVLVVKADGVIKTHNFLSRMQNDEEEDEEEEEVLEHPKRRTRPDIAGGRLCRTASNSKLQQQQAQAADQKLNLVAFQNYCGRSVYHQLTLFGFFCF